MEDQVSVLDRYINMAAELGRQHGPRLLGAIIVLVVGMWIAKAITSGMIKMLLKKEVDPSLISFLRGLIGITLKILVIISAIGMAGVQMTSFIALLGAAGLAIGMALSGTMQNFAGGIIILVLRPFEVDDFIEAQGFMGTVKEIGIFSTILNTVDKKMVFVPNGPLATGNLTNFSKEPVRRVDWKLGISYGDDMEAFKKAIGDFIAEDERIFKDPEHFIAITEFSDSSVNFTVRAWVNAPDYWPVFFEMNEKVYKRFKDYNLTIPFPQMDVHLKKND